MNEWSVLQRAGRSAKLIIPVTSFAFLCVCSGGGDSDILEPSHGVASDREVSELSQKELDNICNDSDRRGTELFSLANTDPNYRYYFQERYCTGIGILSGITKADCEANKERCVQMTEDLAGEGIVVDSDVLSSQCSSEGELAECSILVSDIDACTTAQTVAARHAFEQPESMADTFSCDEAGKPYDLEKIISVMIGIIEQPSQCTSLHQRCPKAFLYFSLM